ncbi:PREDICTED: probable fucosyltransferase 8 [Camelina sativa]|uniref:Fucosyltransferase n=1 Tax=Camelina sativa TaxID=90675 RepID=A0ABM0X4E9_CAMSA|nr:PREDICTED: probable fucosyltransferase 8 [Camelina sativa]
MLCPPPPTVIMRLMVISFLLFWSLMLLSFFNIFNHQFHNATTNGSGKPRDKLLGGLLTEEFDEDSCLSRYQSSLYRKPSPYKPSKYLISKLRSYEKLHKRCGPGTKAYKKATENLGRHDGRYENYSSKSVGECRYIVWIAVYGLGNRILTLASVFLYALLTERVMLVDQRKDISDLFCEPFPGTSWLLPLDFPLTDQLDSFNKEDSRCYGTMLKNHAMNFTTIESIIPSYLCFYLIHDYEDHDKMFFCERDQSLIMQVPWLVFNTNLYFIPSLWLIPSFQTELSKLFPQKETVFHHLARYLIHPTNQVWGMITRSYNTYLSRADERLGIQVRVFSKPAGYFQHVMNQILACAQREKLLPEVFASEPQVIVTNTSRSPKLKAVLVTSLYPEYSEKLRSMYWEGPSSTGEMIQVYQPSQEMYQQTDKKLHDQKALAEIYLLSLMDYIVTSDSSTFGYVAQGLGGLKPWILYKPKNHTAPDPPCVRAVSMEPCFLRAPLYGCQAKKVKTTPFVKYCEDRITGLKLVDPADHRLL